MLKKLLKSIPVKDDIQIIVVDDKSDEDHEDWLELRDNKKFNHVEFYDNETDKKGAGVCRNIGLEKAKGEWLLFADSDDYFVDGFYDRIPGYFDSDVDVVFYKPTSVYADTGEKADRHETYAKLVDSYIAEPNNKNELELRYKYSVPWSKLIKRKLITENNIKFDEVIASNDVMFSTKVGYYLRDFEVDDSIIYCVTRNKGSLTVNMSEEVFDSRLNVSINKIRFLKDKLNNDQLKDFHLAGQGYILSALQYGFGFKKVLEVCTKLKNNNVSFFEYKLLNPVYLFEKIKSRYDTYKKRNKYFTKD